MLTVSSRLLFPVFALRRMRRHASLNICLMTLGDVIGIVPGSPTVGGAPTGGAPVGPGPLDFDGLLGITGVNGRIDALLLLARVPAPAVGPQLQQLSEARCELSSAVFRLQERLEILYGSGSSQRVGLL